MTSSYSSSQNLEVLEVGEIGDENEENNATPDDVRSVITPPQKDDGTGIIESLLIFIGIGIGAYVGVFIRVGISYYKIWKTETNYVSGN